MVASRGVYTACWSLSVLVAQCVTVLSYHDEWSILGAAHISPQTGVAHINPPSPMTHDHMCAPGEVWGALGMESEAGVAGGAGEL